MTPSRFVAWVFQRYWRITRTMTLGAAAILRDEANRILLIRGEAGGPWALPEASAPMHLTVREALLRHLREITGTAPETGVELFAIYSNFGKPPGDHVALFVGHISAARTPASDDVWGFFEPERLPEPISPSVGRRLADLACGSAGSEAW